MRMLKVSAIPIANGATTPAQPATAVTAPAALRRSFGSEFHRAPTVLVANCADDGPAEQYSAE